MRPAQPDRKSRCAADLRLLFPRRDGRAPRRSGVGKQTGALFAASSEFEALWHQRYEVRGVENQIKHFNHPQLGRFSLQQMYWYSAPRNARACWSTCRWTRRASRRWRGWTNINHKESDGWQCAIFGYCPAGAAGRFPPGVGWKAKPCREVFYVICGFSAHCAPG